MTNYGRGMVSSWLPGLQAARSYRHPVAERSGAKTQLTGVTGAALIILMIVLIPGLFRNLPQPALAAVVITASLSLADIPGTPRAPASCSPSSRIRYGTRSNATG